MHRAGQLEPLYDDLEHPLIPVLMAIERAGVRIDGAALASQAQHDRRRSSTTRSAQIYELAGEEFNINSPKKLARDPLRQAGAADGRSSGTSKTKAHSTAFEVLEELALSHELPRLVLEWRGAA